MKAPLVGFPAVRNPCDRDLCWDSSTASHHNKAPRGLLLKGQYSSINYASAYPLETELWIISRSCKSFSSPNWTFQRSVDAQAWGENWKVETRLVEEDIHSVILMSESWPLLTFCWYSGDFFNSSTNHTISERKRNRAALFWKPALFRAVCVVLESQLLVSTAHLSGMRSSVWSGVP